MLEVISFPPYPLIYAKERNSLPARRLLKSLSIKQGIKYDDPESTRDILPFIAFHQLNVDEILEPIESFSTCIRCNEHLNLSHLCLQKHSTNSSIGSSNKVLNYLLPLTLECRKLKPSARPVEMPDDPLRVVSGADCRLMVFESVSEATRLWIKGREFTVSRLLGDTYKRQAERYHGGAAAIFRLAPQDYHRFHSPVDGTIGSMTCIPGEYYTVNVSGQ